MNVCDSWVPKGRLDTKISKIGWPSGPQQSHLLIWLWLTNCLSIKNLKNTWTKIDFINFENPLYFWPNLKSIFTYQSGLKSKKIFGQMFLKLNFTTKYIWGRIIWGGQKSHRTLIYMRIHYSLLKQSNEWGPCMEFGVLDRMVGLDAIWWYKTYII
jgi:hypothetical protein